MVTFSKTDLGTLPHLRWSFLLQLVMGVFTTNGHLHVAAVTQPSLQAKLKSDENGHALKAVSNMISYFVGMFLLFFQKRQLLPVSLTFCVISKINYKTKMKTGITADFIFWGFINRGKHSRMFWKMLLIKCRKNSCAGVLFLKKVKGWNKFILM